jgi:hypothetical protein
MSSGLIKLALRYAGALLPSIVADYLTYFVAAILLEEKFLSFVIGRLVGFLIFYTLATRNTGARRVGHFLAFFTLFLANVLATWAMERMNFLAANIVLYKLTLDVILFLFNFLFFRFVQLRQTRAMGRVQE